MKRDVVERLSWDERVDAARSDGDWQGEIEAIARLELSRSAYRQVRAVQPRVGQRVLRLRGRVPSYYFFKQMAQAAVMHRLEGIVAIENEIVVAQSSVGTA